MACITLIGSQDEGVRWILVYAPKHLDMACSVNMLCLTMTWQEDNVVIT